MELSQSLLNYLVGRVRVLWRGRSGGGGGKPSDEWRYERLALSREPLCKMEDWDWVSVSLSSSASLECWWVLLISSSSNSVVVLSSWETSRSIGAVPGLRSRGISVPCLDSRGLCRHSSLLIPSLPKVEGGRVGKFSWDLKLVRFSAAWHERLWILKNSCR